MTAASDYSQPHFGRSHGLFGQANQQIASNSINPLARIQNSQQQHGRNQLQQYYNALQNVQAHTTAGSQLHTAIESIAEPLKITAIKLGEIIGWRGWKVTPQGFLRSMSADVIWAPGEPMEGKTKSKTEHNGCYAYKTARDFLKNHADHLDVYGEVAMWGDVIEHELGYRGQFAKIISLKDFLSKGVDLKALRARYCSEAA